MSHESHESDDTRITAYVFGELSAEQTAAFEQELKQSSVLRDEVAGIRDALVAVSAELEAEAPAVNGPCRKQIEQAITTASSSPPRVRSDDSSNRRNVLIAIALAASILIVCGLIYPRLRHEDVQSLTQSDQADPIATVVIENGLTTAKPEDRPDDRPQEQASSSLSAVAEQESGRLDDESFEFRQQRELRSAEHAIAPYVAESQDSPAAAPSQTLGESHVAAKEDAAKDEAAFMKVAGDTIVGDSREANDAVGPLSEQEPQPSKSIANLADQSPTARYLYFGTEPQAAQSTPNRRSRRRATVDGLEMSEMGMEMGMGIAMGGTANDSKFSDAGVAVGPVADARASGSGVEITADYEMDMMMAMDVSGGMGGGMAGDRYEPIEDNPFMEVNNAPLSTFSIDVDTASYAKVRMYLLQHHSLPRPDAVRIEELVNYFSYDYAPPTDEHPFAAAMDIASCPWNPKHRLARIGIKGKVLGDERPSSNLVFLLDVSGSMNQPNKLPLVIEGMKMLTDQLTENDSVAIVVYAGAAGRVLDSTSGDQKQTIVAALERLKAGGSTNGGQGIALAYQIARDNFIVGGTNRVILCSDGDFNVGVTGTDELVRIAEENAKSNVYLSVLGFGMGNHNDSMMETVSNKGNGNYAFIDSKSEAKKVLVEQMGGTLVTIAKDVKIQVEFNPKEIASYRLIGYENRIMAAQDFNDDSKDAGEIGAGHTVTALYELVPTGADMEVTIPPVDDLRYQTKGRLSKAASGGEALTLKLRYKTPESAPGAESTLIMFPVANNDQGFSKTDKDFQFAASVAEFGMLLRNSPHKGDATFAAVEEIAGAAAEDDDNGYRAEFLKMVATAKQLRGE